MSDQLFVDDFQVGQRFEGQWHLVDEQAFKTFASLTGDRHPIHYDAAYAARTRFGQPVAHGLLLASLTAIGATALSERLEAAMVAFLGFEADFLAPVFAGDRLRPLFEVAAIDAPAGKDKGKITFSVALQRGPDDVCIRGSHRYLLKRRPSSVTGS
jgi:3-hydroxybutyryl-CoA dehydratase